MEQGLEESELSLKTKVEKHCEIVIQSLIVMSGVHSLVTQDFGQRERFEVLFGQTLKHHGQISYILVIFG